jgi:predicted chitinase
MAVCAIADSFCDAQPEPEQGRVLKAYFATLEEQSHQQVAAKNKKSIIYTAQFRRASQAIPGRKIWLIVETTGLQGVSVEISIRCAKTDALMVLDEALAVVQNGTVQQGFEITIGDWNGGGRYQHTEMYRNWAIAELEPGPASATERKAWAKKLEACTDHRALFYVEVRARTGIPTDYANEDPQRQGVTQDKGVFMNEGGKSLELLTCCRADITFAQLKDVFPGAPADKIQGVADEFNRSYTVNGVQQKLFEIFHVDSCLRRAHFFAQAKVESQSVGGKHLVGAFEGESFNHSISNLLKGTIFSAIKDPTKPHLREAALNYGRGPYTYIYPDGKRKREIPDTQKANEKELANTFNMDINRAPEIRLGNTEFGDGWKFRGHGILQLTGRENYQNAQRWLDSAIPDNDADLLNCGDNFTAFQVVVTGGYYWMTRGPLYLKADQGTTAAVCDSITKKINSGMKKQQERRDALIEMLSIFRQSDCLTPKK